jgi:hypothetical protein
MFWQGDIGTLVIVFTCTCATAKNTGASWDSLTKLTHLALASADAAKTI